MRSTAKHPTRTDAPWEVQCGDAYDLFPKLAKDSVDLVLTSPPYWGLRDYEADHNWDILSDWKGEGRSGTLPTSSRSSIGAKKRSSRAVACGSTSASDPPLAKVCR